MQIAGTSVAETHFMRLYPRADRQQYRLGNVLPDISGEIEAPPADLAQGTGTHRLVGSQDDIPTVRQRAVTRR